MKVVNKKTGEVRNGMIWLNRIMIEAKDYPKDFTIVFDTIEDFCKSDWMELV